MPDPVQLKTAYTDEQRDVIQVLEHMLGFAKEGKVSSVAIAYVRADRVTSSHTWSSSSTVPALIGAISGMQLQLQLDAMINARQNPDNKPPPQGAS